MSNTGMKNASSRERQVEAVDLDKPFWLDALDKIDNYPPRHAFRSQFRSNPIFRESS